MKEESEDGLKKQKAIMKEIDSKYSKIWWKRLTEIQKGLQIPDRKEKINKEKWIPQPREFRNMK